MAFEKKVDALRASYRRRLTIRGLARASDPDWSDLVEPQLYELEVHVCETISTISSIATRYAAEAERRRWLFQKILIVDIATQGLDRFASLAYHQAAIDAIENEIPKLETAANWLYSGLNVLQDMRRYLREGENENEDPEYEGMPALLVDPDTLVIAGKAWANGSPHNYDDDPTVANGCKLVELVNYWFDAWVGYPLTHFVYTGLDFAYFKPERETPFGSTDMFEDVVFSNDDGISPLDLA